MLNNKLQRLLDGEIAVHVSDEETFDRLMQFFDKHEIFIGCGHKIATKEKYTIKLSNYIGLYHGNHEAYYGDDDGTNSRGIRNTELTMADFRLPLDTGVYDASLLLPGDIIVTECGRIYVFLCNDDRYAIRIENNDEIVDIDYNNDITSVIRPDNLTLYLQDKPTPIATIFQRVPTPRLADTSKIKQEIEETISKLEGLKTKLGELQK